MQVHVAIHFWHCGANQSVGTGGVGLRLPATPWHRLAHLHRYVEDSWPTSNEKCFLEGHDLVHHSVGFLR